MDGTGVFVGGVGTGDAWPDAGLSDGAFGLDMVSFKVTVWASLEPLAFSSPVWIMLWTVSLESIYGGGLA